MSGLAVVTRHSPGHCNCDGLLWTGLSGTRGSRHPTSEGASSPSQRILKPITRRPFKSSSLASSPARPQAFERPPERVIAVHPHVGVQFPEIVELDLLCRARYSSKGLQPQLKNAVCSKPLRTLFECQNTGQ